MKRSVKYCCIVVVIAILVGIFTFILCSNGSIFNSTENFSFFYLVAIIIATALLITLMKMQCNSCEQMKRAYCCCGNLATIGATGTIILAFISSLISNRCDFLFCAILALMFFFLILMLGGIVCFLYTLNGCHSECIPEKPDCRINHENNNVREYNRKEFTYPNNNRR